MNEKNPLKWARPAIREIVPYQAKFQPLGIKLDANENPYPWPEEFLSSLDQALHKEGLSRYPDSEARELRKSLAGYTGREPAEILVTNGADEAIQLLLLAFGGQGTATIVSNPTFVMYAMATRYMGGETIDVPLVENKDNFDLDVEGLIEAANRPESRLVIICNPNNPTGTLFSQEDIIRVLEGTDRIIVLDEAYIEFAKGSLAEKISKYPNLVILRTFSKAFALAGLRVGYLLAQKEMITELNKVRQPFNVNVFSQRAAVEALACLDGFKQQIEQILLDRELLLARLGELPLRITPSQANFIFVKPILDTASKNKPSAEKLVEIIYHGLQQRGVLVRMLGGAAGRGGALRITVGTSAENEQLLAALKDLLDEKGGWKTNDSN